MSMIPDPPEGMTVQRLRKGRRRIDTSTGRLFVLKIDADGCKTVEGVYDMDYSIKDDAKEALEWAISRIGAARSEVEIDDTPTLRELRLFV
ncbi:MAG TPA: hypothetical protein VN886_19390 [Acidimicrobiales bacterium]|nr:hypothetical protein [Acidimicrobiales bacterium]